MSSFGQSTLAKVAAFALLMMAAVCFPFGLGRVLWPDGLSAGSEHIFWPATGVGVAGLLILGWRQAWVVFATTLAGQLIFDRSWFWSAANALGNTAEALVAYGVLRRAAGADDFLHRLRPVGFLLVASLLAPSCSSLLGAGSLVIRGFVSAEDYIRSVGVWHLANACSILLLTPGVLVLCRKRDWRSWRPDLVLSGWLLTGLVIVPGGFTLLFRDNQKNFAFLAFPFVLFAAVRFRPEVVAMGLLLVFASVYWALADHAGVVPAGVIAESIWFVQTFCWVLAGTGLLLAALAAERRRAEQQALQERARVLEAGLREERARLEALRYQINPHFLFNALNSIYAALKPDRKGPAAMVGELADYLRSTLVNPPGDVIPLAEEVESVRAYLSIQKKRHGPKLDAAIAVEPAVSQAPVPVFLLQPLVENAIRHGFEAQPGDFSLEIRAHETDGRRLRIDVVNSGAWREANGEGVGLANIRRRLALLYGDRATLEHLGAERGVCMRIELPLDAPPALEGQSPA